MRETKAKKGIDWVNNNPYSLRLSLNRVFSQRNHWLAIEDTKSSSDRLYCITVSDRWSMIRTDLGQTYSECHSTSQDVTSFDWLPVTYLWSGLRCKGQSLTSFATFKPNKSLLLSGLRQQTKWAQMRNFWEERVKWVKWETMSWVTAGNFNRMIRVIMKILISGYLIMICNSKEIGNCLNKDLWVGMENSRPTQTGLLLPQVWSNSRSIGGGEGAWNAC